MITQRQQAVISLAGTAEQILIRAAKANRLLDYDADVMAPSGLPL